MFLSLESALEESNPWTGMMRGTKRGDEVEGKSEPRRVTGWWVWGWSVEQILRTIILGVLGFRRMLESFI